MAGVAGGRLWPRGAPASSMALDYYSLALFFFLVLLVRRGFEM